MLYGQHIGTYVGIQYYIMQIVTLVGYHVQFNWN